MDRRRFLASLTAAPAAAIAAPAAPTAAGPAPVPVGAAVARFASLPGTTSCLLSASGSDHAWQAGHDPERVLFVGSAVKTFVLAEALRGFEQRWLDPAAQWAVDDGVRSLVSPVFANLSGTASPTVVLEAMIAHSDNTATDIALEKVRPERVRALLAQAGLSNTRIPDSTRRLFSYLAGAPEGVDLGWAGMKLLQAGTIPGPPRMPVNDRQSMSSSAAEMVSWYDRALAGAFFQRPATLTEFCRIQSMADAIAAVVPPEIKAYAKGGSIDWNGFQCLCVAGQMEVGDGKVTFCFTINWEGRDEDWPAVQSAVLVALREALSAASRRG